MQWWLSVSAMTVTAAAWLSQGAGGTLVVRTDDNPVQPIAIVITGPVEREVTLLESRGVTIADLPPGRYEIRPVFAGTGRGDFVIADVASRRLTTAELTLDDIGGVRFDADAGMCEPGDSWRWNRVHIIRTAEDQQALALNASAAQIVPSSSTCLREVGGLPSGTYNLTVTPPAATLPPYRLPVRVEPRAWTTVRLEHPSVLVHGRVTSGGGPVSGAQVLFVNETPAPGLRAPRVIFGSTRTDADGRYMAALQSPGRHQQRVTSATQSLPYVTDAVTFIHGANVHDIELGGGSLRVSLTEEGLPITRNLTVTLTLHSPPNRAINRRVTQFDEPHEVTALPTGRYVVTASAEFDAPTGRKGSLAAARTHEVDVSPSLPAQATIDLVPREAWLEVVGPDGHPIEGAHVIPMPPSTGFRTDEAGRVALHTVPAGTRLPIRTRDWGMTCHTVTPATEQIAQVPAATAEVLFVSPEQARPAPASTVLTPSLHPLAGSRIVGIRGATCAVPYEAFSVVHSRVDNGSGRTLLLPPGTYTVELRDGTSMTIRAPGKYEIK